MPAFPPLPDAATLGLRIRDARTRAGLSLSECADRLGVSEERLLRAEDGSERAESRLVMTLADCTDRSVSWFIEPPLTTVASRRTLLVDEGSPWVDSRFDRRLEEIGLGVRMLLNREMLPAGDRPRYRLPANVAQAEELAFRVRKRFSAGTGPITDLSRFCEKAGLFTFSLEFEENALAGSMIEVDGTADVAGVALVNGSIPAGRRRFTLAHEFGHWIVGDDFEAGSTGRSETERLLDAFAVHLLLPRTEVTREWQTAVRVHGRRSAAIRISGGYGVSWSAAVGQLRNLDLLTVPEHDQLLAAPPSWVDFEINDATWIPEMTPPFVSPGYRKAVLSAYSAGKLTRDRTVDLLYGAVHADDLPVLPAPFRRPRRNVLGGQLP